MAAAAREILSTFPRCAYHLHRKDDYQQASQLLYGEVFIVQTNVQNRMVFYCRVCKKEMNNTAGVADHSKSGRHQKNVNKMKKIDQEAEEAVTTRYRKDSLQYKLLTSETLAIGLQMVEEFKACSRGKSYFKCNLCGAHGFIDAMYLHLIGTKHTERYIKKRVENPPAVMTADAREEVRQFILDEEGSRIEELMLIVDEDLYPLHWIKEATPKIPQRKADYMQEKSGVEDSEEAFIEKLWQLNEELLDDQTAAPEDPLDSLELLFALGENLYRNMKEKVKGATDREAYEEWKDTERNMNKFLGLLQHEMIPMAKSQADSGTESDAVERGEAPLEDEHQLTF